MRVEHLLLEKEVSDIMNRLQTNYSTDRSMPLTQLYGTSDESNEGNYELHNTLLENIVY